MSITIAEDVPTVIDIDAGEFLGLFAEVMNEWGFAGSPTPKCEPVRFPSLGEARRVVACSPYAVWSRRDCCRASR